MLVRQKECIDPFDQTDQSEEEVREKRFGEERRKEVDQQIKSENRRKFKFHVCSCTCWILLVIL